MIGVIASGKYPSQIPSVQALFNDNPEALPLHHSSAVKFKPTLSIFSNRSGNNTPNSKKKKHTPIKSQAPIYSWEDGPRLGEKVSRDHIVLQDCCYQATTEPGIYTRTALNDQEDELLHVASDLNNLFVDFQVVLTKEEIITLAARRRSFRPDMQLHKNIAASASPNISTPYVDPKRILLFRPDNPDKWIDPKGIQPYKKFFSYKL